MYIYSIIKHFIEIYKTTKLDIPAFHTLLMIMVHPIPEYRPNKLEMKQFNQILLNHDRFENKKTEFTAPTAPIQKFEITE